MTDPAIPAGPPAATGTPETLALIAGRGAYPLELAASARQQGVRRIHAVAFRGQTDPALGGRVDRIAWIRVGELGALVGALRDGGAREAVMAGQIQPALLFRARMDRPMRELLGGLAVRNAETIFGAVAGRLAAEGIALRPAHLFMEASMPAAGVLTRRPPNAAEERDIALGCRVVKGTSRLDIGQTVVIKQGVVLAVEAFEGTDAAIRRGGRLGGPGAVVVKAAKRGHDMRFDIPVVGRRTLKALRRARAACLAVEAGRTILLERGRVASGADAAGIALVAVAMPHGD